MGQAEPTASRVGDLQIGAGFPLANSANTQVIPSTRVSLPGYSIYSVFDRKYHFGAELSLRQVAANDGSHISERTYELGGRYVRHYGIFSPYAKLLFGRGIYNYPSNVAKLAYTLYTGGAGADVHVTRFMNVRLDYEYQTWMRFPRGDLHPSVLTVGVAYHFPTYCRNHVCSK